MARGRQDRRPRSEAGRRAPAPGGARLPTQWHRERADLLLLAVAVALVPLVWWTYLGWSPGRLTSGQDALPNALLVARELVAAGGGWDQLRYRPDLLGGMKLADAVGSFPLFAWLARAGLGAVDVYNVTVWCVQALIGFLGARTVIGLCAAWSPAGVRVPRWTGPTAVLVAAFAPALGWRVGHGHLNLLTGVLPIAAALALVVAAGVASMTATLALVAVSALALGLLFTGHQLVAYGVVFGAPLLVGLWWTLGRRWQAVVGPAGCAVVALFAAWPTFAPTLAHALGTDAARSLGRTDVVYGYLTGRWVDLWGSLFWTTAAIPGGQPELAAHETNVPIGPLLVALAWVPWRRAYALAVGLAASLAGAVSLALNVRPFSTALLTVIPWLGSFRVPTRALIPVVLTVGLVALAALAARVERRSLPSLVPAVVGFVGAALLPSLWREAVLWSLALAFLMPAVRRRLAPLCTASLLALALAGGCLGAFRERLLPFPDAGAVLARSAQLGGAIRAARPELESPLARVSLGIDLPELGPNTAFAAGLSSLDGYYYPSRRFLELFWALQRQPYEPSAVLLRFPPSAPWTRPFFQLYNVRWVFGARGPGGALTGWPSGPTAGPAWFSASVVRLPTTESLARELSRAGAELGARVHEVVWIVEDDAHTASAPKDTDASCGQARVAGVDAARGRPWIRVEVATPADCPLTLSMNYAETLRAALDGPEGREIAVFPAYGALAGVVVPRDARSVWIAPRGLAVR